MRSATRGIVMNSGANLRELTSVCLPQSVRHLVEIGKGSNMRGLRKLAAKVTTQCGKNWTGG